MSQPTGSVLVVPEIPEDADVLRAAILYAQAGWYVLAIDPNTKRPASFYGKGWQHMTSRDPQEIAAWFAGSNYMLGLHCGRSGAVVFDIDEPDQVPEILLKAFKAEKPPVQSTRTEGLRGHRVFRQPAGRRLGNSRGELGRENKQWGEVRGMNGIIVVEPSIHPKFEIGGRYKWLRAGIVPTLPEYISELLPEGSDPAEPATDAIVDKFIEENSTRATRAKAMKGVLSKFATALASGSRHEALVEHLCWAMRECAYGFYQADIVIPTMESMFMEAMNGERHPRPEFRGALAHAVAQALLIDVHERRTEAIDRLNAGLTMKAAGIGVEPPKPRPEGRVREPEEYFADKSAGINMELLPQDVMDMGDLAVGPDNQFWLFDHGVWIPAENEIERRMVALLGPRYRMSYLGTVESVLKTMVGKIKVDPLHDWMNFANCMLEWRTGQQHAHSPHFGSTVQFPVEWDVDAKCPRFDDFLATVLTEDYVELAWQMIGYLMYSGNPKQKAFMLLGPGGNGKGTLIRAINALLGRENCAAESLDSLNNNRFAPVALFGKIANIAGDIDATYQTSTAAFKKLTGEDTYAGERKYGDRFLFQSWAVPLFSANKVPGSADTSRGYLRRWVVLSFDRIIADREQIAGLSDILIEELPGIAVKAVAALHSVIDGAGFKDDGEVADGKAEFASAIDQVRQWYEECCIASPGHVENRTHVYNSYKLWAQSNGNPALRAQEFWTRMEQIGYKWVKSGGNRIFRGFEVQEMRAFETVGGAPVEADHLPDAFGSTGG
jgi:P4 family phage/plasmid primase-like protien